MGQQSSTCGCPGGAQGPLPGALVRHKWKSLQLSATGAGRGYSAANEKLSGNMYLSINGKLALTAAETAHLQAPNVLFQQIHRHADTWKGQ